MKREIGRTKTCVLVGWYWRYGITETVYYDSRYDKSNGQLLAFVGGAILLL